MWKEHYGSITIDNTMAPEEDPTRKSMEEYGSILQQSPGNFTGDGGGESRDEMNTEQRRFRCIILVAFFLIGSSWFNVTSNGGSTSSGGNRSNKKSGNGFHWLGWKEEDGTTRKESTDDEESSIMDWDVLGTSIDRPRQLTVDTMSQTVRNMEFALYTDPVLDKARRMIQHWNQTVQLHGRGGLPRHHQEDKKETRIEDDETENRKRFQFDRFIDASMANPYSMLGEDSSTSTVSWTDQVLALVHLPDTMGISHPFASQLFTSGAINRAREIKKALKSTVTADTILTSNTFHHPTLGAHFVRQEVAAALERQDGGVRAHARDIVLTNGFPAAMSFILQSIIQVDNDDTADDDRSQHSKVGIMTPIPHDPLYPALIDLYGGKMVPYHLSLSHGSARAPTSSWSLDVAELERSFLQAKQEGIEIQSLLVVNPGNPTGYVLHRDTLHVLIRFCVKHHIVLLADETHKDLIHDGITTPFMSCKRVASEANLLDKIELISFHAIHPGIRGISSFHQPFNHEGDALGFIELVSIDPSVQELLYQLASLSVSTMALSDQITLAILLHPPPDEDRDATQSHSGNGLPRGDNDLGDASDDDRGRGMMAFLDSTPGSRMMMAILHQRARWACDRLNTIRGISCPIVSSGWYLFPAFVSLPPGAHQAAQELGIAPDALFCLSLLEETGIVIIPSSTFGGGRHFQTYSHKGDTVEDDNRSLDDYGGHHNYNYGFRMTLTLPDDVLRTAIQQIAEHYHRFRHRHRHPKQQ